MSCNRTRTAGACPGVRRQPPLNTRCKKPAALQTPSRPTAQEEGAPPLGGYRGLAAYLAFRATTGPRIVQKNCKCSLRPNLRSPRRGHQSIRPSGDNNRQQAMVGVTNTRHRERCFTVTLTPPTMVVQHMAGRARRALAYRRRVWAGRGTWISGWKQEQTRQPKKPSICCRRRHSSSCIRRHRHRSRRSRCSRKYCMIDGSTTLSFSVDRV